MVRLAPQKGKIIPCRHQQRKRMDAYQPGHLQEQYAGCRQITEERGNRRAHDAQRAQQQRQRQCCE